MRRSSSCRGPKAGFALFFAAGSQPQEADLVFGGVTVVTGELSQSLRFFHGLAYVPA
jgi:hypothetical protein